MAVQDKRSLPGRNRLVISTPEIRKAFMDAVRGGVPLQHAATYAGLGRRTMWRCKARGEDAEERLEAGEEINEDDRVCMEFARELQAARSASAVRNIAIIQKVAQGGYLIRRRTDIRGTVEEDFAPPDFRAAKTLLETSFGNEFRASHQLEISGPDGGPVQLESSSLKEMSSRLRARILEIEAREQAEDDGIVDAEVVSDTSDIDL